MRIIHATLPDAYNVHKTFIEYLRDIGHPAPKDDQVYSMWTHRLTDQAHRYFIIMHARKVVGMVWGREITGEINKTFLIEGRFLRRAYRGKIKFAREMVLAVKELTKDFETVRMLIPQKSFKMSNRFKFLGVLVEK